MTDILHTIGYYLAALVVVTMPPAMLYWFLIHPFAGFWRRLGKIPTFLIVGSICVALAVFLWTFKDRFLATHWGYHWLLIVLGIVLYLLGAYGEQQIRKQLKFKILVGTPELDAEAPGTLMTDGVYEQSRNPRYVNMMVALLGWALVLNYPALYVVLALCVPLLYLIVLLEERELRGRFGAEYVEYCRRVPRFLPRKGWLY